MEGTALTSIRRVRRPCVQDEPKSADSAVSLSDSAAVDDLILMLCLENFRGHSPGPMASRGSCARADATAGCTSMLGRLIIATIRHKASFVAMTVQVGP